MVILAKKNKKKANSRDFEQETAATSSLSGSTVVSNVKSLASSVKSAYSSFSSSEASIEQMDDKIQSALSDGQETTAEEFAAMYEQQQAYEKEQLKAIVSGVWNVAKGSVKTLAAIPTDIKNFIPDFNLSKSLPDINSQSGTLSAATDSFKNIFRGGFGTDFNIDEYAKKYTNEVPDQKTENTKTDNKAKKEADEAKIARQAREASGIINWDNYDNQKQAGL